jgi:hypothetical protein
LEQLKRLVITYVQGTQIGEPGVSPTPQDAQTSGYDETMWYCFTSPAQGFVEIIGNSDPTALGDAIDLNMTLYEVNGAKCTGGIPNWSSLTLVGTDDDAGLNFTYENECLATCKEYCIQLDGGDVLNDKGYFWYTSNK